MMNKCGRLGEQSGALEFISFANGWGRTVEPLLLQVDAVPYVVINIPVIPDTRND